MGEGTAGSWATEVVTSRPGEAVTGLSPRPHARPARGCLGTLGLVEFGVLGPLEVRAAAGAVPIRRGYPRTLLIALLLRPGQVVPSERLIDLLWCDELPRNPANALQIQVSYLRKCLGSAEPEGASLLATRGSGYALLVEPDRIDARRFEAAVQR